MHPVIRADQLCCSKLRMYLDLYTAPTQFTVAKALIILVSYNMAIDRGRSIDVCSFRSSDGCLCSTHIVIFLSIVTKGRRCKRRHASFAIAKYSDSVHWETILAPNILVPEVPKYLLDARWLQTLNNYEVTTGSFEKFF